MGRFFGPLGAGRSAGIPSSVVRLVAPLRVSATTESQVSGLDLSAFGATGEIHLQMRVRVGTYLRANGQENLWASDLWTADGDAGQVGTLLEGSPNITGIAGNAPVLRRLAKWDLANDRTILNSSSGDIGALLDQDSDPYRCSFVRLTDSGPELVTLPTRARGFGTSFVDWRVGEFGFTQAMWDSWDAIADGDEVIVAIHQGTASYDSPAVGTPTAVVDLLAGIAVGAAAGVPGVDARLVNPMGVGASAGAPSVSVDLMVATLGARVSAGVPGVRRETGQSDGGRRERGCPKCLGRPDGRDLGCSCLGRRSGRRREAGQSDGGRRECGCPKCLGRPDGRDLGCSCLGRRSGRRRETGWSARSLGAYGRSERIRESRGTATRSRAIRHAGRRSRDGLAASSGRQRRCAVGRFRLGCSVRYGGLPKQVRPP